MLTDGEERSEVYNVSLVAQASALQGNVDVLDGQFSLFQDLVNRATYLVWKSSLEEGGSLLRSNSRPRR
jgi:hypothetical protein